MAERMDYLKALGFLPGVNNPMAKALMNPLLETEMAVTKPTPKDLARFLAAGQAPTQYEENLMSANPTFEEPWWMPPRVSDPLTGETSPARAQEIVSAMTQMPLLGAAMGAKVPAGGLGAALFHGTGLPPKGPGVPPFERFSVQAVGGPGGEGAQAYGHGLYFAENPGVAKGYKSALSGRGVYTVNDKAIPETMIAHNEQAFRTAVDSGDEGLRQLSKQLDARIKELGDDAPLELLDLADVTDDLIGKKVRLSEGSLIEADIPDTEIAKMLDWDKPLSEQSDFVKQRLKKAGFILEDKEGAFFVDQDPFNPTNNVIRGSAKTQTGMNLYRSLTDQMARRVGGGHDVTGNIFRHVPGADKQSSEFLRSIGIPGIKYLDQGSRMQWELLSPAETTTGKWRVKQFGGANARNFDTEAAARAFMEENKPTRNLVLFDDSLVTIKSVNGEPVR